MNLISTIVLLVMSITGFSQGREIKGVILDGNDPVSVMTVIELGTPNGTATDLKGEFTLCISHKEEVYLLASGTDLNIYVKFSPDQDFRKISLTNDLKLKKESKKIRKELEAKNKKKAG